METHLVDGQPRHSRHLKRLWHRGQLHHELAHGLQQESAQQVSLRLGLSRLACLLSNAEACWEACAEVLGLPSWCALDGSGWGWMGSSAQRRGAGVLVLRAQTDCAMNVAESLQARAVNVLSHPDPAHAVRQGPT